MENCVHGAMAECCQYHFHFMHGCPTLAPIVSLSSPNASGQT